VYFTFSYYFHIIPEGISLYLCLIFPSDLSGAYVDNTKTIPAREGYVVVITITVIPRLTRDPANEFLG